MAKRTIQLLLAVSLLTGTLYAADNSFTGKWKLDPAHSRLTDQMKVEAAGLQQIQPQLLRRQRRNHHRRRNRPARPLQHHARHCGAGRSQVEGIRKNKGTIQISGLWQLSSDGKTLTDNLPAIAMTARAHQSALHLSAHCGLTGGRLCRHLGEHYRRRQLLHSAHCERL